MCSLRKLEHDSIWKIGVQPPVVNYFLPDRVFQGTVGLIRVIGAKFSDLSSVVYS
jgi:hypothetical protein